MSPSRTAAMRWAVLAVALFALAAGCQFGGPPPSDGDPVQYNVTNMESAPASVEVSVADEPVESLTLEYTNETSRTIAPPYIGDPTEIRSAIIPLENVSTVSIDGLETRRSLQVTPGDSATGEFTVSQGQTVVVVGRVNDTVRAVGIMRCGENERMNQVAFAVGGYGPLIGGGCQGV